MNKLQKITEALSLLELSNMEITVYLDLLKLGSSPASLIARRLKLNRSTVRYTLENLAKKRFIFQENRNGTYFFTAEDPEKILLLIQNEQREIEIKETAVSQIIGDLKAMKNPHINIPKVRFFEGVDGLIKMYEDVLDDCKLNNSTIYGYLHYNELEFHPEFNKFVQEEYIPTRMKIRNKSFMIFNNIESDKNYTKKDKEMNRKTLLVSQKDYPFKTCFHIYGNKIAFYSHLNEQHPSGVIIEHKIIRDDHLNLFKMAWNFARNLPENKHYKNVLI